VSVKRQGNGTLLDYILVEDGQESILGTFPLVMMMDCDQRKRLNFLSIGTLTNELPRCRTVDPHPWIQMEVQVDSLRCISWKSCFHVWHLISDYLWNSYRGDISKL
jgi:hypothetical protein